MANRVECIGARALDVKARKLGAGVQTLFNTLGDRIEGAVEAARDEDVDRQLEAILERGRRSTRQKKRR